VEARDLEAWGGRVVDHAAELVLAAIPAEQQPTMGSRGRAVSRGSGYVSRYVHLRRPDYPAQLAVWLFVVPPEHPYNIGGPQPRAGAGLMQDPETELDPSPFAAGLHRGGPFRWRQHNDTDYEGYRLVLEIAPDSERPEAVASKLADAALHGLRRAALIGQF
jgi:hypothetical protein